ncbi:MAG: carboxypeptidase regulatory-like domain-containing protein, partial [Acidobacteria bacterium]|nr:carboxypeptidase regulatory-like domain-containing protein [Acidobacteriota bacterium]
MKRTVLARLAVGLAGLMAAVSLNGAQQPAVEVPIDNDDIGGVVRGPRGPEAGVWVIAETDDLDTKYRKMVVTDDQGRYVLPDLPDASYQIWVRGYGLVDSPKVTSRRGRQLVLTAVPAPDEKTAAQYYPANYWFSLMKVPEEGAFPQGQIQSQAQWIGQIKNIGRFQMGIKATREIPPELGALGFKTTEEALRYYTTAGQLTEMSAPQFAMPWFVEWIERIRGGAVPPAPPRPEGVERNLVVTLWDVSNQVPFIHDVASTDKRNPTLNPNGRVYGVEFHNDGLIELDPVRHAERTITIPAEVDKSTMRTFTRTAMDNPSLTWGEEIIIRDHSNPNHLTMDAQGRVWIAAAVNVTATPAYCREGSTNKFAQAQPLNESNRHIAMYDPRSGRFTLFHTCIRTHHVQMATDGTNRLFSNPLGMPMVYFGWIDIDAYERTRSVEAAQGWCRLYFDADGDGRADRDKPVPGGAPYSVIQNPVDGSVWGAQTSSPGVLVRLSLGTNPPETCVGEAFQVPFDPNPSRTGVTSGFTPRGIDVDGSGVIWTALAGSGHLASFDRRKCRVLTGEAAMTGRHCPEGWTLYSTPGPKFQGVDADINA